MKSENWWALGYRENSAPFPAAEKADLNYCGAVRGYRWEKTLVEG